MKSPTAFRVMRSHEPGLELIISRFRGFASSTARMTASVTPTRWAFGRRRCSSSRGMISTKLQGGSGVDWGAEDCRPSRRGRRPAIPAGRI